MIILICPKCGSSRITRYEGKMSEKGHSWLKCAYCKKTFPLSKSDYREECNIYED